MTKSIFCDIDGTILKHHNDISKNILENPTILENVIESFKQWDKANYKIILTTGRKESYRKQTEHQLQTLGIPYDTMVMGLSNGERIIINDKKPNGENNTAYAINVVRNKGLQNIDLTSNVLQNNIKIVKPWGHEEIIEHNRSYVVKTLFMKKGHSCSIQYHELKTETITVVQGKLNIYIGTQDTPIESLEYKEYNVGDFITIKPYTIHKMEAVEDCMYLETSTIELWDVVRLKDNYGRI
jgi:hydroxymethylpyrimidine pyrophosphatase-like HAD family hydrolase